MIFFNDFATGTGKHERQSDGIKWQAIMAASHFSWWCLCAAPLPFKRKPLHFLLKSHPGAVIFFHAFVTGTGKNEVEHKQEHAEKHVEHTVEEGRWGGGG